MGKGGLAFLNKKSWHTGSLKNHERIWKAEQRSKAESKKVHELQKEIEEERQREELQKLQEDAGLIPRTEQRMSWMQYGTARENAKHEKREQFLLGKKMTDRDLEEMAREKEKDLHVQNIRESGSLDKDAMTRMREDPLFAMMIQEKRERQKAQFISQKLEHRKRRKLSREYEESRQDYDRHRHVSRDQHVKIQKYGLMGSPNDPSKSRERHSSRSSRSSYDRHSSASKPSELKNGLKLEESVSRVSSREDKDSKLRKMQANARLLEQTRMKQIENHRHVIETEKQSLLQKSNGTHPHEGTFIEDLSKEVYLGSEDTLEKRLRKNRHYIASRKQLSTDEFR